MSVQSGHTILIVDDSEELLDVLRIVLEKQGHTVITKNSPDHISTVVLENKIDLLLLDVIFPGANGRKLCKQLKSDPFTNYFPILLMSVTPDFLTDFKECEADCVIEKPFDLTELLRTVDGCLKTEPAN